MFRYAENFALSVTLDYVSQEPSQCDTELRHIFQIHWLSGIWIPWRRWNVKFLTLSVVSKIQLFDVSLTKTFLPEPCAYISENVSAEFQQDSFDTLFESARKDLQDMVRYCKSGQLSWRKPTSFRFFVSDPIFGEFNHVLQMDQNSLKQGNILHMLDIKTYFRTTLSIIN